MSIVIPCLNEAGGLADLRRRIAAALEGLDGGYEVIVVDDGSTDDSVAYVERWIEEAGNAVLVKLSRNFGMEVAMSAGLDYARGTYVVLMHADLQDPPELIPEMVERATAGADVVYARRIGRDESIIKRTLATAFYALMRRLARVPFQGQAGDFRLMCRRVVDALRAMPERRRFLRGMVAWVGYDQVPIEYRRAGAAQRARRLISRAAPARVRGALGFLGRAPGDRELVRMFVAGVSGAAALVIFVLTLAGAVDASLGVWVLFAVLFLGGVQLVSVGILGRYLARVHAQVLDRPLYLIDRVVRPTEGRVRAILRARSASPGASDRR